LPGFIRDATARSREQREAAERELLARWAEPHRRYHTTTHLTAVLAVIDRYADLAPDPDAVRLAAWFHDAVYDPRAGDNEERSALLAERVLTGLGTPSAVRHEVARLVRLTADHAPAAGDANGALLSDADLAILAADEPDYLTYTGAIRQEYAHVPDDAFRRGRTGVLRQLLDLPTLYRIVPERAAWTARAHANMRSELARLNG
jgi:predicted metal-dependent HD superfamily phosphohydrolase